MKLGFPVEKNAGIGSELFGHFGSAPAFIVVDTMTRKIMELPKVESSSPCGGCVGVEQFGGQRLDAVVVGAIGASALKRLHRAGVKVYQARSMSVADNIAWFTLGELSELRPGQGIGINGHGHSLGRCCGF